MKWGELPWDRITAIVAAVTSIAALSFSWCALRQSERFHREQVELARHHNALSVRPLLNFGVRLASDHPRIGLELVNEGLGPAKIHEFEFSVDGKAISTTGRVGCQELAATLNLAEFFRCFYFKPGALLRAGEGEFLLGSSGPQPSQQHFRELSAAFERLGVAVCYCSLYEECWLHTHGRPARELSCPARTSP